MTPSLVDQIRFLPSRTLLSLVLISVMVVGYFDYITGYEISFFLIYGGPIFFSVWFLDRNPTLLVVFFSALVWWWADWKDGHPYTASWIPIWETLMRLGFFLFVAIGGSAIKSRRDAAEALLTNLNRMRELERDIVAASEREQQRIGADLHDGLCQYLAGMACVAGSLHDDLSDRFQPEAETVAELHELLKDAVLQARNIARGIAPVHMDEAGLTSALEELAANTRRMHEVECAFEPEGEIMVQDREMAIHLYRIAQEATSNAIRHGHATKIAIQLAIRNTGIVLTVRDNGVGIPAATSPSKGMGIRSMRYRAGILNGEICIEPIAAGGTEVCCCIPISVPANQDSIHAS